MAKLKLNGASRSRLSQLFTRTVACPREKAAMDKAYTKAAPLVLKVVLAKFPASDMAVLDKYKVARVDTCIKLQLTAGGVVQFEFAEADAPKRPDNYECQRQIFAADARTTDAFEAWSAAKSAYDAALKQKCADYKALINGSTYMEEVESIWPQASEVRAELQTNLPATLTPDIISRIRADANQRRAA